MNVHSISTYRASRLFLKQAPILLKQLQDFDKMLTNYCIYPPIYKLRNLVRDTATIIGSNIKIAENTLNTKGKVK